MEYKSGTFLLAALWRNVAALFTPMAKIWKVQNFTEKSSLKKKTIYNFSQWNALKIATYSDKKALAI